jgi:hypothetical protein
MEQLPPVPWDQLATRDDLAASLAFAAARF